MKYTVENNLYKANDNYIFLSKKTQIPAKIMRLANSDSVDNYEVVQYYQAPEGQIYERIADGEQISLLFIKEKDSLLNYKLVPIKDETESI